LGLRVVAAAAGEDDPDHREDDRRREGSERTVVELCVLHRFSFVEGLSTVGANLDNPDTVCQVFV
jgi:hypothetical protein